MSLTRSLCGWRARLSPNLTQGLFHCTLLRSPLPFPEHALQLHLSLTRDRLPDKDSNVAFHPLHRRQTRGRSSESRSHQDNAAQARSTDGQIPVFQHSGLQQAAVHLCRHGLPQLSDGEAALLAQGFEVQEDFIDATHPRRRWREYKSDFLYVADEVGKSDSSYAAASALMEMGKKLFGRKTNG